MNAMNAQLQPGPRLCLYSCGWSDVPDHYETLARSFVFDISQVGHDPDVRGGPRWEVFGGDGDTLDRELSSSKELGSLLDLLKNFIARFLESAQKDLRLIIAVICAWGKHRSRWLIKQLEAWLEQQSLDSDYWFCVEHLSEFNRRQELQHYHSAMQYGGCYKGQAISSAKNMGLRRNRRQFVSIQSNLYRRMESVDNRKKWVDVKKDPAPVDVLEWCVSFLLFRAEEHRPNSSVGASSAARSSATARLPGT